MAIAEVTEIGTATIQSLPDGYMMRPARMDDLDAIVVMLNTCSKHLFGVEKFTAGDFKSDWSTPRFDLDRDTRVVIAPDGMIAGYYDLFDQDEPYVRAFCWGQVHPLHTGKGISWALLNWAEQRARQTITKAPDEARVVLIAHTPTINRSAEELFRAADFSLVRYYLRMVIDLNGQPPEPAWPEGITLRGFVLGEDDSILIHALRESFSDHWGYLENPFDDALEDFRTFWRTNEKFDSSLYFLAMDGDEVAGISMCYPFADDDPEMGWVGSLGVCRPWRRIGLGLALLQHSFLEFHRRGKRKVGLGVDAQSLTGATRLYTKAGMRPDPLWQTSVFEKELRAGRELRTQSVT